MKNYKLHIFTFLLTVFFVQTVISQTDMVRVSGKFINDIGAPMPNVLTEIELSSGEVIPVNEDGQGQYFFDVPVGSSFVIRPFRNTNIRSGLSVADIIIIQRHILGQQSLDGFYKRIAADVNNNQRISASDLIEIFRAILNITTEFSNNTSWRYIPEAFDLYNPSGNQPGISFQSIEVVDIQSDLPDQNFVSIKVGDVNNSVNPNIINNNPSDFALQIDDIDLKKGQSYNVDINLKQAAGLNGLQLGLHFDASIIAFNDCASGAVEVSSESFLMENLQNGDFKALWYDVEEVACSEGDALFTLQFVALKDGRLSEAIYMDKELMPSLAVIDDESKNLYLDFTSSQSYTFTNPEILQSYPNPFTSESNIPLYLPNSDAITLNVISSTGVSVHQLKGDFTEGNHNIVLDRAIFPAPGTYFCQIQVGDFSQTIKVILVD